MDIVLLANNTAILRLLSHPISHQLNLSAVFNIEPNMEEFQDDLLPHYVGGVSAVCLRWPLLFTVTEDGIVCIHLRVLLYIHNGRSLNNLCKCMLNSIVPLSMFLDSTP